MSPPPRPRPIPAPEGAQEAPPIEADNLLAAISEIANMATDSGWESAGMDKHGRPRRAHRAGDAARPRRPAEPAGAATDNAAEVAATRVISSLPGKPIHSGGDLEDVLSRSTLRGELSRISLISVIFRLAVREESGLLVLYLDDTIKEIYFNDGDPLFVTSNRPDELFGQFLIRQGALTEGELSMALAMLPHFDGKLGNALVSLNLFSSVEILRHLTQQAHEKLLEAFNWTDGAFLFYNEDKYELESAPVGLNAFELIGAAAMAIPAETIERRVRKYLSLCPRAVRPPVPLEVFRLGQHPKEVLRMLDGETSVEELLERFEDPQLREKIKRYVYLLFETRFIK